VADTVAVVDEAAEKLETTEFLLSLKCWVCHSGAFAARRLALRRPPLTAPTVCSAHIAAVVGDPGAGGSE